jgi:IS1 family transposase
MNQLSTERRAAIVRALVEGNSARAAARLAGTSRSTVLSLLAEVGELCRVYQRHVLTSLNCQRIQCDEIWSFVGAKSKRVLRGAEGVGDVWTFTALDPDSKLMVCWLVGSRSNRSAREFIGDLSGRLARRVQITTDGYTPYISAVEGAFGWAGADFAQLIKIYASNQYEGGSPAARRYSPGICIGAEKHWIMGSPDPDHVSTSMVERTNLGMRMGMRRFTRLTNAFSRKVENHAWSVDIHFMHYNFCRPHMTLTKAHPLHYPTTPAMAAGVARHVWSLEEVCALLDPTRKVGSL